ncbi:hypothetical protein BFR04_07130 [Gaetbulibacter sp. 4G1]|nr:hypothetical protein BFR04_07130 [Gaetbulibacter sp. 4G1]
MSLKSIKKQVSYLQKKYLLLFHYLKYFSLNNSAEKKKIIVCFDGVINHGGLVDRLKGIISFYQIAKTLDYDFYILFSHPFKLETLLEPADLDWKLKNNQIKWHPFKTKLLYLVNNFNTKPLEIIKQSKADTFYVYANIDYSTSTFSDLTNLELETKWRNDFNSLFKKSDFLNKKLEEVSTESYIAFHLRFTSIMGDFKDTTTNVLSENEKEKLQVYLLSVIKNKTKVLNKQAYVFSDSINFINYITSNSNIKAIEGGQPLHMDNFEKDENIQGHLKTLIDFFMLGNSEIIYFLKADKMYNSSFSKYAAIVGQTKFEHIEV